MGLSQAASCLPRGRFAENRHPLVGPMGNLLSGELFGEHDVRQLVRQGRDHPVVGVGPQINATLEDTPFLDIDARAS